MSGPAILRTLQGTAESQVFSLNAHEKAVRSECSRDNFRGFDLPDLVALGLITKGGQTSLTKYHLSLGWIACEVLKGSQTK